MKCIVVGNFSLAYITANQPDTGWTITARRNGRAPLMAGRE